MDRLRALWDFDDLDASEARFRAQLAEEASAAGRAEVLTQLARVEGLRGDFDAGERHVEEAESLAGDSEIAQTRIDLERGRLRRSSGDPAAAYSLFVASFERARSAGELYVAADAAHMAALAAPDDGGFVEWTNRGIELAQSADPSARYWLGPLLNNLGWQLYESNEYDQALDAFQRALDEREREPENRAAIELALYAVGKALRALGRADEAVPLLERAVASAAADGRSDGWLHEELAESYAAVGRSADASDQARLALPLLAEADPDFEQGSERAGRLRDLVADNP
jgi:tetratricopeptide (TPR) repeat protein